MSYGVWRVVFGLFFIGSLLLVYELGKRERIVLEPFCPPEPTAVAAWRTR